MKKEVSPLPADNHDPTITGILQQVIASRLKHIRHDMEKITTAATGGFEVKTIGPAVAGKPAQPADYQA